MSRLERVGSKKLEFFVGGAVAAITEFPRPVNLQQVVIYLTRVIVNPSWRGHLLFSLTLAVLDTPDTLPSHSQMTDSSISFYSTNNLRPSIQSPE